MFCLFVCLLLCCIYLFIHSYIYLFIFFFFVSAIKSDIKTKCIKKSKLKCRENISNITRTDLTLIYPPHFEDFQCEDINLESILFMKVKSHYCISRQVTWGMSSFIQKQIKNITYMQIICNLWWILMRLMSKSKYLASKGSKSRSRKKNKNKNKNKNLPTLPIFRPKGQTNLYFLGLIVFALTPSF